METKQSVYFSELSRLELRKCGIAEKAWSRPQQ